MMGASSASLPRGHGYSLRVAPGFLFFAAVGCSIGFWFFPVLGFFAGGNPDWAIAVACLPPFFFGAAAVRLRAVWILEVDSRGLRVLRGRAVTRSIAWERMTHVRYGETLIGFGGAHVHVQMPADFLDVRSRSPRVRIWLGTEFFRLDPATFNAISARVIAEANHRGVRVVKAKSGSWV